LQQNHIWTLATSVKLGYYQGSNTDMQQCCILAGGINVGEIVGNVFVQKRGVVSLGLVRGRIPFEDGDVLQVMIEDGKIVLVPMKLIPLEQSWFWTAEWQEAEKEAQADIKAGKTKVFPDVDELLEELDS
jgi:hypothetical protein